MEADTLSIQVIQCHGTQLVCTQAGEKRRFLQYAAMRRAAGQQTSDLLRRYYPALGLWCGVEWSKSLEDVIVQVASLNAPVTKSGESFGIVRNSLSGAAQLLKP